MSDLIIYLAVFSTMTLMFSFGFLIGFANRRKSKKKYKTRKSKYPPCNCKDVNDCHKWCHAKELFTQDSNNGLV